ASEADLAAFRRVPEDGFNRGDLAALDEVVAADYTEHVALPPGIPSGLAGLKEFVSMLRGAFPDFNYTTEEVISEGDRIVGRFTGSATQGGEFMGTPATGKRATWSEIHIGRYAGGKLVEHWAQQDALGMMQQLGVIPAPGQAG